MSGAGESEKALSGVPNQTTSKLDADSTGVVVAAQEAEKAIKAVPEHQSTRFDLDSAEAQAAIERFEFAFGAVPDEKAVKIFLDASKTQLDIEKTTLLLDELGRKKVEPKVELDIQAAELKLLSLQAHLLALDDKKHQIKVDVDSKGAITGLNLVGSTGTSPDSSWRSGR